MIAFLRWLFSNSGAIRGVPDIRSQYAFARVRHPMVMKRCPYCDREYWAFTKGNKYCGSFRCFKLMLRRRKK